MNERNARYLAALTRFLETTSVPLEEVTLRFEDGVSACLWWQEETESIEIVETTEDVRFYS